MKTKNGFRSVILFIFLIVFCSNLNSQMRLKDRYYLGAYGLGIYYWQNSVIYFYDANSPHWSLYNQLNFNLLHQYSPGGMQWDWEQGNPKKIGSFYDDLSPGMLWSNLNSFFSLCNTNNQKVILERHKIDFAAYGQRSTYQAEYDPALLSNGTIRPGYGFGYRVNNLYTENWNGETISGVKSVGLSGAQYLVSNLYENCEQINSKIDDIIFSDTKKDMTGCYPTEIPDYKWYIKPRMRIENYSGLPDNTPVVEIEAYAYNGTSLYQPPVIIKLENFKVNGVISNNYLELYDFGIQPSYPLSVTGVALNSGNLGDNIYASGVDYRVKWCGNCDVYLDYVRVDDEWAHFLFNPTTQALGDRWQFPEKISEQYGEATLFSGTNSFGHFHVDEFQYNNIPCIVEAKRLVKQASGNQSTVIPLVNYGMLYGRGKKDLSIRNFLKYDDICINELINKGIFDDFVLFDMYPFVLSPAHLIIKTPPNLTYDDPTQGIPDIIHNKYYNNKASNSEEYNEIIQNKLEAYVPSGINYWTSQMSYFRIGADILKKGRELGKDITICHADQIYAQEDENSLNDNGFLWREPTNEEISFQVFLGLIYGAKQTLHFEYNVMLFQDGQGNTFPFYGLADASGNPRYENVYKYSDNTRQQKWNYVVNLDARLKAIGDYMYPAGHSEKHLIYDDYRTVNTFPVIDPQPSYVTIKRGLSSQNPAKYIMDIQSIYRDNAGNFPIEPNCINCDPEAKRYWELGFFNPNPLNGNPNDKSKYFIALNKRCTPESPGGLNDGDVRLLKIKFNPSELPSFNNWKLIDPVNNIIIATIDKNSNQYYSMGTFQPGEGKLFKLSPVMHTGGTFVCNEVLSTAFDCEGTVYNNGYNLTVHCGTNINFSSTGKIVMNGGSFICNYIPEGPTPDPCYDLIFQGKGGLPWEGLSFNGCSQVLMDHIIFNNIAYGEDIYQNCAISITNCFNFAVTGCTFNISSQSNGINLMYNDIPDEPGWGNTFVYGCKFHVNNSLSTPVNVVSVAGPNTPVKIENSIFMNETGASNPYAILLSNVTGGVVQSNFIHKFDIGIYAMSSSIDFFWNKIYSDRTSSIGLYGLSESTLNLIPVANYFTGGFNKITTVNSGSKNISVENSYFDINNGYNTFNLSSSYTNNSQHLYGYFNGEEQDEVQASNNCFQVDTIPVQSYPMNPIANVKWGSYLGNSVNFYFLPYSCNEELPNDYDVFGGEGLINDTVYMGSGGEGGSFNEQFSLTNVQFEKAIKAFVDFPASIFDLMIALNANPNIVQVINYKAICDSISINLRKRNYTTVEERCKFLLTNYPDSIKSIDLISKLYLASLSLDSCGNKINTLKIFFEALILNNQGKTALINRTFYFIQKCKVILKQYQSAMQGFNTIMQQNPYSYEGLVASWDYAATYLLDSLNGHGGSFNDQLPVYNVQLEKQENNNIELLMNRAFNSLDSTKFSKQDRKVITKNVSDIMNNSKKKQVERVDELQSKSTKGDKKAQLELKQLRTLNEVIKPKRPNTIFDLKRVISNDIKKVFKKTDVDEKEKQNILPLTYNLSQNYPNPFNPVTKINYELPKDGRVKLVIYDILGKEIKTLVNELKQAGRYTIEFNGNNYASGVYFYRIQVEGGKSYTAVKKMMLIK